MLDAFNHYRNGFLPVAGGMQDQAASFVTAMGIISQVYAVYEEIESKRA